MTTPAEDAAKEPQYMAANDEINRKLAAVLLTLAEVEYTPESIIYITFGMDLEFYRTISDLLVHSGMITVSNNMARITDAGRAKVIEIKTFYGL